MLRSPSAAGQPTAVMAPTSLSHPTEKAHSRFAIRQVASPWQAFSGTSQDLSFWQRNFTKPVHIASSGSSLTDISSTDVSQHDGDSHQDKKTLQSRLKQQTSSSSLEHDRKFSILSRGAICTFVLVVMIIVVVLVVTLATTLTRPHRDPTNGPDTYRKPGSANVTGHPLSPDSATDPYAFQYSKKPIRLGILTNFPDPSLHYDLSTSTWYAFGTNDAAGILRAPPVDPTNPTLFSKANVQMATSRDFLTWTLHDSSSDPLPTVGNWSRNGMGDSAEPTPGDSAPHNSSRPINISPATVPRANVWAPDMIQHPSRPDTYIMYYSAAASDDPHHCIGAATASTPAGPYDPAAHAIACPVHRGGAIDPVAYIDQDDNNAIYVVYKIDGNSMGHGGECNNGVAPFAPTPILLQKMQEDGTTKDESFEPIQILDRDDSDGPLVEAPALVKVGETFYLFYSSGCTRGPSYDVKYATASKLTGPYTRHGKPLLKTGDYGLLAPGSVSVRFAEDNVDGGTDSQKAASNINESYRSGWKMAVHGRVRTNEGGVRAMFSCGLEFDPSGQVNIVDGTVST